MADEEKLRDLVTTVIAATSADTASELDLEDIVIVAAGRRQLVRIVVDGDSGVSLDAAAAISRAIAAALDAADATGDSPLGDSAYTLEVSSPGIGRPLSEERHFRRARGRLVTVKLLDGSTVEGRVRRVADGAVELLTGPTAAVTAVSLAEVRRAKVDVEFGKMPPAHVALLDADGFVDPARAFDEVEADEIEDDELVDDEMDDDLDDGLEDEDDDLEDEDDDLEDDPEDEETAELDDAEAGDEAPGADSGTGGSMKEGQQ